MPKKNPSTDRRIVRTREALRCAFHTLILEKGYDAVTVHDIVQRANVARSTFYAHHAGKESVLLDGIATLREFLLKVQRESREKKGAPMALFDFSGALFEHAADHRDLYHALMGDRGGAVMARSFRQMLDRLMRRNLTESLATDRKPPLIPLEAAVRYSVEALMGVLTWWVEAKPQLPPSEGDRVFRQLVVPSLAAAGYGSGK